MRSITKLVSVVKLSDFVLMFGLALCFGFSVAAMSLSKKCLTYILMYLVVIVDPLLPSVWHVSC